MESDSQMEDSLSPTQKLFIACSYGEMDVIESVLKNANNDSTNININSTVVNTFVHGKLPLHQACKRTDPWVIDVVTKLLIHGANVDLDDENEWNALDYALCAIPFQPHVAQLLLDCSKKGINRLDPTYFNYLWTARSVDALKFVVKNGIDVNHVVENGTYLDSLIDPIYDDIPKEEEIEYLRSVGAKECSEL